MNKKFTILVILILLVIAGGVFWRWQGRKEEIKPLATLPEGIEYATPETGVIEGVVKPALFNPEDVVVDPETGTKIIKDEIGILFKDNVSEEERNEIVFSINGEIVGYGLSGQSVDVKIKNNPSIEDLKRIVKKLNQNPKVEITSLSTVGVIFPKKIPDPGKDPQWKDIWDEKNPYGRNWGLEAIYASSGWDYNDSIKSVKLGIVDIGFEINHEDLRIPKGATNLYPLERIDEINSRIVALENRKECVIDEGEVINHGTHIAGIIGALSNNEVGITGIVWNRDLSIYEINLKTRDLLKGVEWLLNQGSKIINLSWGFNPKCGSEEEIENWQRYYNAELNRLRKKYQDFLIIQAAGNSKLEARKETLFNPQLDKPKYEELKKIVITVGAIENKGRAKYKMANFSNFGDLVDVVAPGVDIYSTFRDEGKLSNLLSFNFHWSKLFSNPFGPCFDFFNNSYGCMQGTSMAAPFVTGVAGLVWGANPNFTAEQVKTIIVNSADRPISYKGREYKILNAKNSVKLALEKGKRFAEQQKEEKLTKQELETKLQKEKATQGQVVPPSAVKEKPKEELIEQIQIYDLKSLVISPNGSSLYVTTLGPVSSDLIVVDTQKDEIVKNINPGIHLRDITITPDGSRIYSARGYFASKVDVINTTDYGVVDAISVGFHPGIIAISLDGSEVYVGGGGSLGWWTAVDVIDAYTNKWIKRIETHDPSYYRSYTTEPIDIVIAPNKLIYLLEDKVFTGKGRIFVIDKHEIQKTLELDSGVDGLAITPNGKKVYIVHTSENKISVMNTQNNEIISTITVEGYPKALIVSPDNSLLYVASSKGITIINTSQDKVIDTISTELSNLQSKAIAITPDGSKLYVGTSSGIRIIRVKK